MLRFLLVIVLHLHLAFRCTLWMLRILHEKDASMEKRWAVARRVVATIVRCTKCRVEYYGEENLPKDTGYLLMPNHQGRFDGLAVVSSHGNPLSFVLDKARADILVETYFTDMTKSERISKSNSREAFQTMSKVRDRVRRGDVFCVFPEGQHAGNCNTLQDFHTGCFHFVKEMDCPIVPCVLVDSWRVFNYLKLRDWRKRIAVKVYFLEPILPNEYCDLSKKEIAALVKSRIARKLSEVC